MHITLYVLAAKALASQCTESNWLVLVVIAQKCDKNPDLIVWLIIQFPNYWSFSNTIDPDEMPRFAVSHLGPQCLLLLYANSLTENVLQFRLLTPCDE